MIRRPPISTRTDTLLPYTSSSDLDRDSDLPHGKATRRQRDNAAGKAEHGDDLAARTLEEVGELGERGIEGGIGAGECWPREPENGEQAEGDGEHRTLRSSALFQDCLTVGFPFTRHSVVMGQR